MSWSKPDLDRIRNAVFDSGFKATPVRGEQFRCQCPVHQGVGLNVQFKMQPSGKISFDCFSQHCGYADMLDVLDLVNAGFYPDHLNLLKQKPRGPDPSLDDWCLVTARDNRKKDYTLTESDKSREFEAFNRRRNGILSPEIA